MATVKSIQFRFKSPAVSTTTPTSQSLFTNIENGGNTQFTVVLEHTASATSGSYSGSIVSPSAKYADLILIHEDLTKSASVSLPFLDGGWWSIMVTQADEYTYTLYAANKVYDGVDGNTLGFEASASFSGSLDWTSPGNVYFPGSGSINITRGTYTPFTGSLQELRYFSDTITKPMFRDFVQNANSIEGSSGLFFRAALGGELYTASSSIHPKAGAYNYSPSFTVGSTFTIVSGSFIPNYETTLVDQVVGGIRNRISTKIKQPALVLPASSSIFSNIPVNTVLAAGISIQQNLAVSESYTRDINYAEIALSPQNEINDDINDTYGYINIGEYIGDPTQVNSTAVTYPQLDGLRNSYFTKYNSNYSYSDYVRLSKYYDNAIFQMVKDYVPVRAGVATGIVIKQHLLERNRVRPAQVSYTDLTITGSILPQSRNYNTGSIEVISAGPGGSVNSLTGSNQAWSASYSTPVGLVTQVESSQYEFYNGEYSGSEAPAQISYSLNYEPLLNNVGDSRLSTLYQDVDYSYNASTPVNMQLILSGSASAATVPDSNYSIARNIIPRYLGSKNTGEINYSQSFSPVTVAPGYPIDSLTPWFAHFNGIYGSAELGRGIGGNLNVTQLINAETGDTVVLTSKNENLDFLGQLFKKGDTPSIAPTSTDQILEGAVEIEAVGELYQTILMKSGSTESGDPYPNGALSFSYSSVSQNPGFFYYGIAVTQSYAHPTFPSQDSWRGYATTTTDSSITQTLNWTTVTTSTNIPPYGLPSIYTTPGTAESRSLAAEEIKRVFIQNATQSSIFPDQSIADFQEWTVTIAGSVTEADNNLTGLPNYYIEAATHPIVLFFSASSDDLTPVSDTFTINYPKYTSGFEDGWFDLINSGVNYPGNFPGSMQSLGNVYIYNKLTNEYTQEVINTAEETYFPIQRGDFIRVGTTASIDTYAKVGSDQISPLSATRTISHTPNSETPYTIISVTGNNSNSSFRRGSEEAYQVGFKYTAGLLSALPEVEGLTDPADYGNQSFRIMRRVPTEFYILLKNRPGAYTGEGLLLPENFDPKYDARKVAKELGII